MEPTVEQVAWATMAVGELNRECASSISMQAWLRTMRLAELVAERDASTRPGDRDNNRPGA